MAGDDTNEMLPLLIERHAAMAPLHAGMTTMQADVTTMRAGVARIRTDLGSTREAIAAIDHRVTACEIAVAEIRRGTAGRHDLIGLRTDLMARMDRLQNRLDNVCHDLTVNYGANEHVERIPRSAMEETRTLSDMLNAMQRQVRRVSAKVFGPEDEVA